MNTIASARKRERFIIVAGLVAITVLAWAYMFYLAANMAGMDMDMAAMSQVEPWNIADLLLTFVMWAVMMAAMMTPSVSPMVLAFAHINRQRQAKNKPYAPTSLFLSGYLLVWAGFSALATLFQWSLHAAALLSPMMVTTSPIVGGVILVAAGAFQFTPLKHACLAYCRTPMGFILTEWRDGRRGALLMGLKHGRYCLGCCWFLMALLFVAGVMNLLWVAAIATFVLIEKVAPASEWVSRIAGLLFLGWGIWILSGALISLQ
jgi:predicted metal-binding membrane protein